MRELNRSGLLVEMYSLFYLELIVEISHLNHPELLG